MEEKYNIKSGEVFLTLKGDIIFHCTLCESKYQCFADYARHIGSEHLPIISVNLLQEDSDFLGLHKTDSSLFLLENEEKQIDVEVCSPGGESSLEPMYGNIIIEEDETVANFQRVKNIKHNLNKNDLDEYKCTDCEFACKLYKNLIGHMKRHSSYKPYQCTDCNKAFYTRFELTTHVRSHTGEKPYLCSYCSKCFITSGKLAEHIKRHTGQKDYQCKFCNRKFFNKQNLSRHLTVHTNDRDFTCKICMATFKRRTALSNHRKLHENKRQYKCELCPAKFNQRPGLYSHLKIKHAIAKPSNFTFEEEIEIEF